MPDVGREVPRAKLKGNDEIPQHSSEWLMYRPGAGRTTRRIHRRLDRPP